MNEKTIRRIFLFTSIGLFAFSLTQKCFCTTGSCGDSAAVFLVGILGLFYGGAALTWLANPILLTAWIAVKKGPMVSLIASLISTLISVSFLFFSTIIDNEGGHYNEIISYQSGYWLWVSSSLIMLIGNIILRSLAKKQVGS